MGAMIVNVLVYVWNIKVQMSTKKSNLESSKIR